jgi:4-aminobutyrate aminotransferase
MFGISRIAGRVVSLTATTTTRRTVSLGRCMRLSLPARQSRSLSQSPLSHAAVSDNTNNTATTTTTTTAEHNLPSALLRIAPEVIAASGSGSWIQATNGRKYLDMTSGIGVTSLGHCPPAVVKAIQNQAESLLHGQLNCSAHTQVLTLVDKLRSIMPDVSLNEMAFANSGSEAVEIAIKMARHATGKQNVIVFQGGFHGRTIGAGSLTTAKTFYRAGYQPMMAGVFVAPYAYCHRCPISVRERQHESIGSQLAVNMNRCCNSPLEQLELIFKQQTAPQETAAILFEPILGEGGYVMPPTSFVKGLRTIADKYGVMLICDEVQSGFGRTGKMFAIEHFDHVVPDMLIMAKGIASGMPLSAVATTSDIINKCLPGSLGGTYAANAVACAAANAVIDEFKTQDILTNVNKRAEQFNAALTELSHRFPISDIRGAGLMIGVEFDSDVPPGTAGKISRACADRDMLLLTAGVYDTLRIIPPLNVTQEETERAIAILEQAMTEVFGQQ